MVTANIDQQKVNLQLNGMIQNLKLNGQKEKK